MVFKVTKCMLPDDKQIYFCREHMSTVSFLYYLKHEHAGVLYQIWNTRAQLECFISDKARTANVWNGLKNAPSDEFIGDVILKLNVV
jgi:hypothetical protein